MKYTREELQGVKRRLEADAYPHLCIQDAVIFGAGIDRLLADMDAPEKPDTLTIRLADDQFKQLERALLVAGETDRLSITECVELAYIMQSALNAKGDGA